MAKNKLLKIGLVIDDSLDKPDGVQQYVVTLGQWLTSEGHTVHYLTSETARDDLPNLHELSKKIKTKFNGNSGAMPLPANTKQIQKLLYEEAFDVLHIQMPYSPLLAGRIIKKAQKNVAIIGTFHIFPDSRLVSIATRMLGIWVQKQLKRFNTIMSVSAAAQKFAKETYHIDTKVVPNMIDVSTFSVAPQNTADHIEIVFLGRLVERKGVQQLLSAVLYIVQNGLTSQSFQLTVGGKGILREELEAYVKSNGLEKIVRFVGFVAEEDKADFLARGDIAVFPSTGGESFGISLLEAMAATPGTVIAGDNPGYRTVMGVLESQLVDPYDIGKFAEMLTAHITNKSLRQKAAAAQKQHVQQFDTPVVGRKIVAVYRDALQHRR